LAEPSVREVSGADEQQGEWCGDGGGGGGGDDNDDEDDAWRRELGEQGCCVSCDVSCDAVEVSDEACGCDEAVDVSVAKLRISIRGAGLLGRGG
jgi:hypothetical protein